MVNKVNSMRYHRDDIKKIVLNIFVFTIAQLLCSILHFCISRGHYYLDVLKRVLFIPGFQSGDRYSLCNYRAISTLLIFNFLITSSRLSYIDYLA